MAIRKRRVLIWISLIALLVTICVGLMNRPDSRVRRIDLMPGGMNGIGPGNIKDRPNPGVRRIDLMPGGMNGIGPGDIEVINGVAYTVNQRNCTISAVDLKSGKILRWTRFKINGGYTYTPPDVTTLREALMESDGRWLYLAVSNHLYCFDPDTLQVVSARNYPSNLLGRLRHGKSSLVADPCQLVWLPKTSKLAVLVRYWGGSLYNGGWSVMHHLQPRSLREISTFCLAKSSDKPPKFQRPLDPTGPLTYDDSEPGYLVELETGRVVGQCSYLWSGLQIEGNSKKAYELSSGYYNSTANKLAAPSTLAVYDPLTGWLESTVRVGILPVKSDIYDIVTACSPDGKRMFLTAETTYPHRILLSMLDSKYNQISGWNVLPGFCVLRSVHVDWKTHTAYLTDEQNNCIRVVDIHAMKQIRQIPLGFEASDMWYDSNKKGIVLRGWMNGYKCWRLDSASGGLEQLADFEGMYYIAAGLSRGPFVASNWKNVYVLHEEPETPNVETVNVGPGLGEDRAPYKLILDIRDLETRRLVGSIDAGRTRHPMRVSNPTLLPVSADPHYSEAVDERHGRMYRVIGKTTAYGYFSRDGDATILVWDMKNHRMAKEIHLKGSVLGYALAYVPLIDSARQRMYLPAKKRLRIIDTASDKEIAGIPIMSSDAILDKCLNERTGRVHLLIAEKNRRLSLLVVDPASGKQKTVKLMNDRQRPDDDPNDYGFPSTNLLAVDLEKSEVYILSPWDASIQVYKDTGGLN